MSASKSPSRPSSPKPAVRAKPALEPGTRAIRLLMVDDHPVVREGLRACFKRQPQVNLVGEARSGEEALRKVNRLKPDVVLMDINLPGISGLTTTAQMCQIAPAAKVLILSVHDNREYIAEVGRSGAHGYILKDAAPPELLSAIQAVHRGEGYFSPSVAAEMLKTLSRPPPAPAGQPDLARLSGREREVLAHIAAGASSKAISAQIGVAMSTVKTLRERLMRKLDLHNIAALTQFAVAQGLTAPAAVAPAAGIRSR